MPIFRPTRSLRYNRRCRFSSKFLSKDRSNDVLEEMKKTLK